MPTTFEEWVMFGLLWLVFWVFLVAILGEWPCDKEHVKRPSNPRILD